MSNPPIIVEPSTTVPPEPKPAQPVFVYRYQTETFPAAPPGQKAAGAFSAPPEMRLAHVVHLGRGNVTVPGLGPPSHQLLMIYEGVGEVTNR